MYLKSTFSLRSGFDRLSRKNDSEESSGDQSANDHGLETAELGGVCSVSCASHADEVNRERGFDGFIPTEKVGEDSQDNNPPLKPVIEKPENEN